MIFNNFITFFILIVLFTSSCKNSTESDTTPPTVIITSPADGVTISSPIIIKVDASDKNVIKKVEFLIDGEIIGEDKSNPFEQNWNVSYWADGNMHTILAKAYDKSDNVGQSELVNVIVSENAESQVEVISPKFEVFRDRNSINLYWRRLPDAEMYELDLASDGNFDNVINTKQLSDTLVMTTILDMGKYWWRVRGQNLQGLWSVWSNIYDFIIAGPLPPVLYNPSNMSRIDSTTNVDFIWYSSEYALAYNFELSTSKSFSGPEYSILVEDTTTTISDLTKGEYFWRIKAKNMVNNWGEWSSINRIEIDGPDAPLLISPSSNSNFNTGDEISFEWQHSKHAISYNFELSSNRAFSDLISSLFQSDTSIKMSTLSDGQYFWRVRGRNSSNIWGDWSLINTFLLGQGLELVQAYYPFEGNANDMSGNRYHGTAHGAVLTEDRLGNENSAYLFDGDDYIDISYSEFRPNVLFKNSFTIEAWIKLNSTSERQTIISFGYDTGDPMLFEIYNAKMTIHMELGAYMSSNTSLQVNKWYNVKLVGILGQGVIFYLDGMEDGSTGVWGAMRGSLSAIGAGYAGNPGRFFNGVIDDVKISILK